MLPKSSGKKRAETGGEVAAKKTGILMPHARYIVSLKDKFVTLEDVENHDPSLRTTQGDYFIKYNPPGSIGYNPKAPYALSCDMLPFRMEVNGPTKLRWYAEEMFPEVAWILRNTTYDDYLFHVAKMHPGTYARFCISIDYIKKIEQQITDAGLDPKKVKPLVTCMCREEEAAHVCKEDEFSLPKTAENVVKYKNMKSGKYDNEEECEDL